MVGSVYLWEIPRSSRLFARFFGKMKLQQLSKSTSLYLAAVKKVIDPPLMAEINARLRDNPHGFGLNFGVNCVASGVAREVLYKFFKPFSLCPGVHLLQSSGRRLYPRSMLSTRCSNSMSARPSLTGIIQWVRNTSGPWAALNSRFFPWDPNKSVAIFV